MLQALTKFSVLVQLHVLLGKGETAAIEPWPPELMQTWCPISLLSRSMPFTMLQALASLLLSSFCMQSTSSTLVCILSVHYMRDGASLL